jgi:hypothetical protein
MTISRGSRFASDLFVRHSLQMRIAWSMSTKLVIFSFLFQNSKEPAIIVTRMFALIFSCQFLPVVDSRFAPKSCTCEFATKSDTFVVRELASLPE